MYFYTISERICEPFCREEGFLDRYLWDFLLGLADGRRATEPKKQRRELGRFPGNCIDEDVVGLPLRLRPGQLQGEGERRIREGDETFWNTSRRVICGIGTIGFNLFSEIIRVQEGVSGGRRGGCECFIIGELDDVT